MIQRLTVSLAACLLMAIAGSARAATDPATNGPYSFGVQTIGIPVTQGATLSTDVFYPAAGTGGLDPTATPCPVVLLGHGFFQSKARHENQGRHVATRGYIVLIPNFAGGSDHARNGRDLSACIDWLLARNSDADSFLFGAVNANAIGASGHSAGGLSAILAAAQDTRIRALSLMDPVDNSGQGVAALAFVQVPVAMTWSEPSSCNANGSSEVLYAAAHGIRRGIKIVGANHTDPQDPAGFLSIITCGSANSARQARYRRYMVGWFEFYLRNDAAYAPWVFNYPDGPLASDLGANLITYHAVTPLDLGITWLDGTSFAIEVSGPHGQWFSLDRSPEQAPWQTGEIFVTPASPVIEAMPGSSEEYFRATSLP